MKDWKQAAVVIFFMLAFAIFITIFLVKAIKHYNKKR
jgi:hypothetical protein